MVYCVWGSDGNITLGSDGGVATCSGGDIAARGDGNITAVLETSFWVVDGGTAAWGDGASLPIRSIP